MALHRGIQSAIFYYLSCAPCTEVRIRKKRKQDAQRDRADREALEAHMPGLYRHPSPSSTNPYWQAEMELGPHTRRGKKKTTANDSQRRIKTSATQVSGVGSAVGSSVELSPPSTRGDERHDSKWNWRPYQREDDELWGSTVSVEHVRTVDDSPIDRMPAKPQRAVLNDSTSYDPPRNPPLNDLHPPIVTKVRSREDVAWMMQPPPVAAVMSGNERPGRSRSNSGESRPSAKSANTLLSRQVSNRLIEKKLRAGEAPEPGRSRANSARTDPSLTGQRHDRMDELLPFVWSASSESAHKQRKERRRPPPLDISEDSNSTSATIIRRPSQAPKLNDLDDLKIRQPRRAASRPQLSTIASDSALGDESATPGFFTPLEAPLRQKNLPSPAASETSSDGVSRNTQRSPNLMKDSSLDLLQKKVPAAPLVDPKPLMEAKVRLPVQDLSEEESLSLDGLTLRPEFLDSWYTPNFELPDWIHEHTKREVKQRWSMDF